MTQERKPGFCKYRVSQEDTTGGVRGGNVILLAQSEKDPRPVCRIEISYASPVIACHYPDTCTDDCNTVKEERAKGNL